MTSLARILANIQNAKRSTGPKTWSGKARSSRNAYQHGLAASAAIMHEENAIISNLTESLTELATTREQKILSRQIAEQECQVIRARYVRRGLLANGQLRMAVEERRARSIPSKKAFRIFAKAQDFYTRSQVKPVEDKFGIMQLFEIAKLAIGEKSLPLPDGFKFISSRIKTIDRYEQRAISKRNALIRQFVSIGGCDG